MAAVHRAAIDSILSRLGAVAPDLLKGRRDRLKALQLEIGPLLPKKALAAIQKEFDEILEFYHRELQSYLYTHERQTRESMALLAALASISTRDFAGRGSRNPLARTALLALSAARCVTSIKF